MSVSQVVIQPLGAMPIATFLATAVSSLIALLVLTPAAEAQVQPSAPVMVMPQPAQEPAPVSDKSHINVNVSMAGVRDLTRHNRRLPGVSVGVDLPIGRGRWATIEGGRYGLDHDPIRERGEDLIPHVTRFELSLAGRVGRRSGNGPFFQIGAGHVTQRVDGIIESRNTLGFERDKYWLGPGLGVDVRLSRRFAIRLLGEVRWFAGVPRASRIRAGLVYRFQPRTK